jgi:2-polyprenyl-3-methyl-5-hydroxy-6-metoxy-1,4-benzoquinol methylase
MPDFSRRSYQQEMLDLPINDKLELRRNLKEISTINKLLGGDQVTIKGLKKLLTDKNRKYTIIDIGCGDGGLLRRIWKWTNKIGYEVEILGIDIEEETIRLAKEINKNVVGLNFQRISYEEYFKNLDLKPDIIVSTLFCHHLDDDQLKEFLDMTAKNAKVGFIINDLHRHFLAYYSIKWLTALFSRSKFTKNDAPLSVERGFKKTELKSYLNGIYSHKIDISWQWAFRYLIVGKN